MADATPPAGENSLSEYSASQKGITEGIAVDPPKGLVFESHTKHTIGIAWQAGEGNIMYDIERSTDGVEFVVIGSSITDISFTDTGLKVGTTYWYRVCGYDKYTDRSVPSDIGGQMTAQADTIDPLDSRIIYFRDGNIRVYITSGTFEVSSYIDIKISTVSPGVIEANEKLAGLKNIEGTITEFNAFDVYGIKMNEMDFKKEVKVEIHYDEADMEQAEIEESTLKMYVLDEECSYWKDINEDKQSLDPGNNYVSATIEHFSVYCLMGSGGDLEILNMANYPNPFANGTVFTFELTREANVTVSIFTMSGRMVRKLEANGLIAGYNEVPTSEPWKGTDASNSNLANGTYIYRITATSTISDEVLSKTGKLVIMR